MTGVGNVYGEALYQLAKEESLSGDILQQLRVLDESFRSEPEFIRLLASPALPKAERCGILDSSFRDKVHPYLLNFLKILTEKGYVRHFSDCCKSYTQQYNLDNDILPVTAVTAVALSAEQKEKLSAKLAAITGKTVALNNRIDPAVLGGVRLDYDGIRMDDTVSHRMESLRELLNTTVL